MAQNGAATATGTIEGIQSSISLNNTWGGTNLNNGAAGTGTALNPFLTFGSSFVDGIGGSGEEIDMQAVTGSTYRGRSGLLVTHTSSDAVQGAVYDDDITLADQSGTSAGSLSGISINNRLSQWPLDPTHGSILKAELGFNYATSPSSALSGIDLLLATFSGYAFRTQGWFVDGSGDMQIGTCSHDPTSTGNSIDCTGSIGTAVALSSGGSSWPTDGNTYYAVDANGGVYELTINTGTGVVTAVSMYPRANSCFRGDPFKPGDVDAGQDGGAVGRHRAASQPDLVRAQHSSAEPYIWR